VESLFASHRRARPTTSAFAVSAVIHGAALFGLLARGIISGDAPAATRLVQPQHDVVWFNQKGPGGGGGGGGNRQQTPPRQVKLRGNDHTSIPATNPPGITMTESTPKEPQVELDAPVLAFADSDLALAGILEAAPESLSQGPGDGGGAGSDKGRGIGPGPGNGLGPGSDRGAGDGVYRIGSGVTPPVPLHREKPHYTLEAMRARIEGAVIVECVVRPDGACANVRILRSLDEKFGLDQQALRAATAWRFLPGTRMGRPVAVLVTIQLTFSIH
jgi:TonB family protein